MCYNKVNLTLQNNIKGCLLNGYLQQAVENPHRQGFEQSRTERKLSVLLLDEKRGVCRNLTKWYVAAYYLSCKLYDKEGSMSNIINAIINLVTDPKIKLRDTNL